MLATTKLASRWATLVPISLALAVFVFAFATGIASGVSGAASRLPSTLYSLTAVLSSQFHELQGSPYHGYKSVEDALKHYGFEVTHCGMAAQYAVPPGSPEPITDRSCGGNFRNPAYLNALLRAAASADTCGSPLVFNANNDQGIVDFIRAAFSIFGTNVAALYNFYFLLMLTPVVLYLLSFWRDYRACVLLFACACAVYVFMPSWLIQNNSLLSVATQRFLSTLGIIPVLHILQLIQRDERSPKWLDIATAVGQAAFISFAYAIRASSIWMVVAVAAALFYYTARPFLHALLARTLRVDASSVRRVSVALLFVATFLAIEAVRAVYLTPACGTALNAHPFWHTIYYSLQFGPRWDSTNVILYKGLSGNETRPNPVPAINDVTKTGDEMVYEAVQEYVEAHHLPYQTKPTMWYSTTQSGITTSEGMPLGSWVTYEQVVRSMFFDFVRENPQYVLENFLIVKPLHFLVVLRDFLQTVWHDLSPARAVAFCLMVVLIAGFAPIQAGHGSWRALVGRGAALLVLGFAIASIPSFVLYANTWVVADQVGDGCSGPRETPQPRSKSRTAPSLKIKCFPVS
jgi:hypothetical protein